MRSFPLIALSLALLATLNASSAHACRIDVHALRESLIRRAVQRAFELKGMSIENLVSMRAGTLLFKGSDRQTTCPTGPWLKAQLDYLVQGKKISVDAKVDGEDVSFE